MVRRVYCILMILAFSVATQAGYCEDAVQASGRVLASDGKTPVEGATIAVYDEKANAVAHAKTGPDGRYTMDIPKGVLHMPDEPKVDVVVIARDAKTGEVFELAPAGSGVFKVQIPVDKKSFAKNDQTISIVAYARESGTLDEARRPRTRFPVRECGSWTRRSNTTRGSS